MKLILFKILDLFKNILSKFGINRNIATVGRTYDFFYRLFWPYHKIIEIQGSKMLFDSKNVSPAMLRTFDVYIKEKIHERATTELFKEVVKEGNAVVDLGANIGYFTLLSAKLVGPQGKVFAFEPEPENYKYLVKNIEINNYRHAKAFKKAVSNENGKTKLYICDYDIGHHTIRQKNGLEVYSRGRKVKEKSIEVETTTLDGFFRGREELIDVIKMDVEGAEMLVLLGMDDILRKNKKLKMFIEFFPLLIEKMGNSPEEFIKKLLEDYSFSIYIIPDDYDAQKWEMIEINSAREVMNFCSGKEDHINLFLEKKWK